MLTQNSQLFPGQTTPNLGRFVTTRPFSCCLSVLRPEFRTLFSPVPWEGFQILCSSLLKELTEFVSCLGVSADDTRQISLARQPRAEFNTHSKSAVCAVSVLQVRLDLQTGL